MLGLLAAGLGLLVMNLSRRDEGCGAVAFFLLGLTLAAFGAYLLFFEDGQGAARWLPFLRP